MHQGDCLSNFNENSMSSLSTIYHYASLALQRNFLLVCFLLQSVGIGISNFPRQLNIRITSVWQS